jgi:hypothetical protein
MTGRGTSRRVAPVEPTHGWVRGRSEDIVDPVNHRGEVSLQLMDVRVLAVVGHRPTALRLGIEAGSKAHDIAVH